MRWTTAAALAAALGAALPAAADGVCRPDALGSVSCPAAVPRPLARPPGPAPVQTQALDRVRARGQQPAAPDFIPARRTNRLGGIVIDDGGAAGTCRADTLGNLRCR